MTKKEAIKQLNVGYIVFIAGILLGVLIHQNIGLSTFSGAFMSGYFFWSLYWGYKIFYRKIPSSANSPVHINANGTGDYLLKSVVFRFTVEFIKFWVCYFLGVFGGALFKQIQLSRIAYL